MSGPKRPRLDAIARDDALLDALGRGEVPDPADPVVSGLAAWRATLDAPAPAQATHQHLRGRLGRGVAVAAVASAVGLGSITGMAAAATQAHPGSALWPLTRVVAPERAESRVAAQAARDWMERARAAAAEDRRDDAAGYLARAEEDARRVRGDDGAEELRSRAAELRRRLATPGGTTPAPEASPTPAPTPTESPTATPSGTPSDTSGSPRPIFSRPAGSPSPSPSPSPSGSPARSPHPQPQPTRSPQPQPSASPSPSASPGLLELLLPGMFGQERGR